MHLFVRGSQVQTVKWHPVEEAVLLTAAYDKTMAVLDVRTPSAVVRLCLFWGHIGSADEGILEDGRRVLQLGCAPSDSLLGHIRRRNCRMLRHPFTVPRQKEVPSRLETPGS